MWACRGPVHPLVPERGETRRRPRRRHRHRGRSTVRRALLAGVIDELWLDIVPVLLGSGEGMVDGIAKFDFEPDEVLHSPLATNICYRRAG